MDEDELLYREMNEEASWYMGDTSDENDNSEEDYGEEEKTPRRNPCKFKSINFS